MCRWFCDKVDENPDFLDNLWPSDEAHFLLSGHVNSKSNIFWGSAPPEDCLQRPFHSIKCTAWVAISKHGIIGSYWFEDDSERSLWLTLSTTLKCYRSFGQHWDNEEALRRIVNGFSRMVIPFTLQMKLCNGSDNVLGMASSVGDVESIGHYIRQT